MKKLTTQQIRNSFIAGYLLILVIITLDFYAFRLSKATSLIATGITLGIFILLFLLYNQKPRIHNREDFLKKLRKKLRSKDQQLGKSVIVSTELVQRVVHEIKNPLNNIMIASSLLEPSSSHIQELIERNCLRINELINELLEKGDHSHIAHKISPKDLIEQTLLLAEDKINLFGIRVVKQYYDDRSLLTVNIHDMKTAILNILVNAIEAMNKQGGVLTITLASREDHCLIAIADTGPGIAPSQLQEIFVPYFTSKPHGTGLGLTHSREIICAHGGTLDVASNPGNGTTFTIRLNAQK